MRDPGSDPSTTGNESPDAQRLRDLLEVSAEGFWDRDLAAGRMRISARMNETMGLPPVETVVDGWAVEERVHPEDLRLARPEIEAVLAGEKPHFDVEYRFRHADGSWRWGRSQGKVVARDAEGCPARMAGTLTDIHAQKVAGQALRLALLRLKSHVANSPLGVVEWSPDFRIADFSRRAEEMFGWSATEVIGKRIDEVPWVPEEDWPAVRAVVRAMETGSSQTLGANRNRRKDGSIIHCEWHNSSLYDEEGKLVSVFSLVQEVTDREKALAALRESRERLALFIEHAPAAIAMFDREMRYLAASRCWAVDYGLGDREIIGRSHYEVFPDLPERWKEVHRRCLAGAVERMERDPFPRSDGSTDWVNWEIHPWRAADGEIGGVVMLTEVVTERVELQAKLAMSARLAALGTLVAGLAHEINNPLAGELSAVRSAISDVERVRTRLLEAGPADRQALACQLGEVVDALQDAQSGGQRIAALVRELGVFGHADQRRWRASPVDVVKEAVRRLPAGISGGADIRVEDAGAPDVMVSTGQLIQVVVDLLANAAQATRPGERALVTIVVGPGSPGMARIEVIDRGVGIAPELRQRIFDPFFTTREVGQGMGLGLPVCHAIVTEHRGTLTVKSAPGQGSAFRVELPATTADE
jgi:PAS domain S-box-containing protein